MYMYVESGKWNKALGNVGSQTCMRFHNAVTHYSLCAWVLVFSRTKQIHVSNSPYHHYEEPLFAFRLTHAVSRTAGGISRNISLCTGEWWGTRLALSYRSSRWLRLPRSLGSKGFLPSRRRKWDDNIKVYLRTFTGLNYLRIGPIVYFNINCVLLILTESVLYMYLIICGTYSCCWGRIGNRKPILKYTSRK
jgi:hypothetical protein